MEWIWMDIVYWMIRDLSTINVDVTWAIETINKWDDVNIIKLGKWGGQTHVHFVGWKLNGKIWKEKMESEDEYVRIRFM
jgi:hypothetical protein